MSLFRHVDGRIMKRTAAGGIGGGVTSHFDELATAEEAAEFKREEGLDEEPIGLGVEPEHTPFPDSEPHHEDGEIRPSEAAPNA